MSNKYQKSVNISVNANDAFNDYYDGLEEPRASKTRILSCWIMERIKKIKWGNK